MRTSSKPPRWRREFLRVLGLTANATLSAELAGIDKTTAYHARGRSPLFDRLWVQAAADARAAIADGRVPEGLGERVRRPLTIRSSKSGKTCLMATGEGRWNEEVEAEFFARLAATGNVKEAARCIGMSETALYNRRKIWPAFDARWSEVVGFASERLAVSLLTSANNVVEPCPLEVPDFDMSVDQAIRVAQLYEARRRQNGELKRQSWRRAPTDIEAVKAEIVRKARLLSGKGEGA